MKRFWNQLMKGINIKAITMTLISLAIFIPLILFISTLAELKQIEQNPLKKHLARILYING